MADPLIATKLYAPKRRSGQVARPRILERLSRAPDARLTLVSASAGFGKTTLLADWLAAPAGDRGTVGWLSLDAADRDPASFWAYVLAALANAVPGVGPGAAELLASSPGSVEPALTALLNDLAAAGNEVWLVLDDYHLADGPDVAAGMTFLLEHLPATLHVVIGTRADPSLPLSRWRARGELVEIRAADLRFTRGEAAEYLNAMTGLTLGSDDVAVLEERTEGWIAALQLAALSLAGRDDVSGFIARFAGDDRYIVDYLVEEVLAHQPAGVRDFLLLSSILDRLTGPLCDAVTGGRDGSERLEALERANLFLVALDDRREWYRYHHLFADMLRARLLSERPEELPLLHSRASEWYERQDLAVEAVRHAMAAGDIDRATRLIEQAVPALRRNRQDAILLGWLKALPDGAVRRSPVLSVFSGYTRLIAGDLDGAEARFGDAERALSAVPDGAAAPWVDGDEVRTLPATVAVFRASMAQARGDVAGTAEHARSALRLAGPTDHLSRGGAAGFLGMAAWAKGDVSEALETFGQAVTSLHAAGNVVDELSSTVVLSDLWLLAGRPSRARRLCERALQAAEGGGERVARATAELHVALSELDVEAGDHESAGRHLRSAAALQESAGMAESRYRWFVAMARVARAEADPERAIQFLNRAEELFVPGFFPDVRPIAAMRARTWISQGLLAEASDWARERGVSVADEVTFLHEFDHLTLVRLLLAERRAHPAAGGAQAALALLDRLGSAAEGSGRAGSLLEIRMLRALAQDADGARVQAQESLAQALELAPEPDAYLRLFLDEGEPMTMLLRDASHQRGANAQLRRLLALSDAPATETVGKSESPVPPLADPLSDRELQVLRLLDTELSGPEIARRLFVSHNTLRSHTKHIYSKLDVTSRRAAVLRAREQGLI